jgi:hypothetical protein
MIGKQKMTKEGITRFCWEHPEGLQACGAERLWQLCRSYIHETKLKRSRQGRINRMSCSVWTTLSPTRCLPPVRLRSSIGKEEKPYADLPRILLVAAYLCSYNPTRADIQIISKLSEGCNKKLRGGEGGDNLPQSLQGHSSFTLDRLWAVCGALLEVFDDGETKPAWGRHSLLWERTLKLKRQESRFSDW